MKMWANVLQNYLYPFLNTGFKQRLNQISLLFKQVAKHAYKEEKPKYDHGH